MRHVARVQLPGPLVGNHGLSHQPEHRKQHVLERIRSRWAPWRWRVKEGSAVTGAGDARIRPRVREQHQHQGLPYRTVSQWVRTHFKLLLSITTRAVLSSQHDWGRAISRSPQCGAPPPPCITQPHLPGSRTPPLRSDPNTREGGVLESGRVFLCCFAGTRCTCPTPAAPSFHLGLWQ